MAEYEQLFVYGTLRPPLSDTPAEVVRYFPMIAAHVLANQSAQIEGAELYDLGAYPAATPGQGTLHGDLLQVEAAALSITDRIEGHPTFFRRASVMVQTATEPTEAWIYWAPTGLTKGKHRVASGDWLRRAEVTEPPPSATVPT